MFKKIISAYTLLSLSEKKLVNFLGFSYGFFFFVATYTNRNFKIIIGVYFNPFYFLINAPHS